MFKNGNKNQAIKHNQIRAIEKKNHNLTSKIEFKKHLIFI